MNLITDMITWYQDKGVSVWMDLLIAISIILICNLFRSAISYIMVRLFRIRGKNKKEIKKSAFYAPLKTFLLLFGIYIAFIYLKLPESVMLIVNKIFRISVICLVAKGIGNLVKPDSTIYNKLKTTSKFAQNEGILQLFSKIIKGIVYVLAAFVILAELGYDLNGVVAGLGLGSVVVALAAQDIAKSLLAGAVIFMDRPFAIGDYVQVKEYEGTIEDINFRSTKIRLLNGSIVTIPNQILTTESIINWNDLKQRRYETNLGLSMNTKMEQVETVIHQIEKLLKEKEEIKEDSVHVYFSKITADSINLSLFCNTTITAFSDYLQLKEQINMMLMKVLQQNEVSLAYPSQEVYLRK